MVSISPQCVSDRLDFELDALSEILTSLTVERVATVRFESRGPYALRFSGYRHIKFGAVLSGRFTVRVEGREEPLDLEEGDCYLQTDERPYRTSNGPEVPEEDGDAFFAAARDENGVVRLGDGEPDKIVIGGCFVFDEQGAAWLRAALPPVVHIVAASPHAAPLRATFGMLRAETASQGAGRAVVVDRLADILLVQALRAHLAANESSDRNWLAGLADPRIGRALRRFHDAVDANWTVATLASAAGMSRSAFAAHFHARVGMAPLDYLTRWRMVRVRRALIDSDLPFGTIAARNGYRSRTSCSQAFKRAFGYTPNALRAAVRPDKT